MLGLEDANPDVGRIPQRDAPMLAQLSHEIFTRPLWAATEPLEVDAETFKLAREEMVEIQKSRGFPLATAKMDRPNFLLRGVPVVMRND